ncbi:MAG: TrmH family RNA methyltransferase [Deltaproteobacteria bacterium]
MAFVPPFDLDDDAIRALLQPLRNGIAVAVYNCQNPFAVGGIIRVAHSFLVREIIVIGREPYYAKASMGMHRYERVVTLDDGDAFFAHVGERPVWAIEKEHADVGLYGVESFPDDAVFVFGSERAGLPDAIVSRAARVVGIPMYGINHSFPVSVAAGMVLGEWSRRRYAPGTVVTG